MPMGKAYPENPPDFSRGSVKGDLREVVSDWARNNPDVAEKVADELYQLLKQYKEEQ